MPTAKPSQPGNLGPVELLMAHTENILRLEAELRLARLGRTLAIIAVALMPTIVLGLYVGTIVTWRKFNMAPIYFPSLVTLIILGIFSFYYFDHLVDEDRSVGQISLDLELARERRRMQAAILDIGSDVRQQIYRDAVPQDIDQFKREGKHYRRIHNLLQAVIIVGSLAASTLTGLVEYISDLRWIAVGATFSVGVAAGFSGYFKFRERSFYLQLTADSVEQELSAVNLGIGRYRGKRPEVAIEEFTEQVELLKLEQRKRQQQLEQPSGGRESVQ